MKRLRRCSPLPPALPLRTTEHTAAAAGRVKLSHAIDPLVLAVDIGSTASRGDVYDAAGRPVWGGREKVPHHFTTRDDGTSQIDPDQIVGGSAADHHCLGH